jgi:transcriptional regulator GlxA family with amidase domain
MSRRNFSRLFKKAMGTTFTQWLLSQRLTIAQQLLETSNHNIDRIANQSGFSSSVNFRQQFLAAFSISPSAYRKHTQITC